MEPVGFRITRIMTNYAQKLPGHWSRISYPRRRSGLVGRCNHLKDPSTLWWEVRRWFLTRIRQEWPRTAPAAGYGAAPPRPPEAPWTPVPTARPRSSTAPTAVRPSRAYSWSRASCILRCASPRPRKPTAGSNWSASARPRPLHSAPSPTPPARNNRTTK